MLSLSPAWDKRFEQTDTYAGAMNKGYLNPTNETTTAPFSTYNVTVGHTADPDPLAVTYDSPHNYKTDLEAQLTHYTASNSKNSSASIFTMWEMATALIRCAGQDSTCIQRYQNADSAFNGNMCTGDLDMAWRSFRQMYLDVKNNLINAQLESPCPSPTVSALIAAGHQPHFTDAAELIAATGTDLPDTASSAKAQAQSVVTGYYASTCQAYVTMWWQDLRPCNYGSADSAILMPRLVNVCEAGSDANHPYGASSVNPSSTYPYKSFEDVITQYNDSLNGVFKPVPLACNAYTITAPAPYDQQVIYSSKPLWTRPDSCECSQIGSLYDNYQLVAGSFSSFSDYLNKTYQTQVSDSVLTLLRSLCNSSPTSSTCNYFATPISLPPALQCSAGNSCVGCTQFKQLDAEFRGKYPGIVPVANPSLTDSTQLSSNQLYTNFMNYRLGFSKTVGDYLVFLNSCSGVADSSANGVGATGPTVYDTAKISCNGLDSLLRQYKLTYLQPVTGYTDLDMRTFAGNITPAEGPKGVFNIYGKLIGNTIDSSTDQVNISFAQKWNSDTADQRIGTLTALSNGKFHLQLNSGQFVPTGGIVGMRYYQIDDPYDTLDAVLTNLGSYIDFGDSTGIKVDSNFSSGTTKVQLEYSGIISNYDPFYIVAHAYSSTRTRTVTIYHTDIYGTMGFDNWWHTAKSLYLPRLQHLRGYAPQDCKTIIFHSTQDSSCNTFGAIVNAASMSGIEYMQFMPGDGSTPFAHFNFGSFQNFHNLQYFWYQDTTNADPPVDSILPNMPVNFPSMQVMEIRGGKKYAGSMDFTLPRLRWLVMTDVDSSTQTDRILNQIASGVTRDSGIINLIVDSPRTSASNAAVASLAARHWGIHTASETVDDGSHNLVKPDTTFLLSQFYPASSQFTDFINGKFGTALSKKGVDSLFLRKCGVLPNTDTPDSSGGSTPVSDTCSSYTFIHTYGGSGTELAQSMVQTADGGYLVAGQTNSFGSGGWDGFVMKTDKRGVMQWSKTYGGAGDDTLVKIRNTRDGGFIALGNTTSFKSTVEPFLVKGDANGQVQWYRTLNAGTTHGENAIDVIQNSDGGYTVATTYDFLPGFSDWEVVRLDSTGSTLWAEHMGSSSSDDAGGLVEDRDTIVFSGLFYSNLLDPTSPNPNTLYDGIIMKINRFNGNIIWAQTYDFDNKSNWFTDINNTANGYIINTNEQPNFDGDSVQQVVLEVDKNGIATTVKRMATPSGSVANEGSLQAYPTSDGGFVTAQTQADDSADVYLQKSDNSGSLTWSNRIHLAGNQQIYHVLQNADGSYAAAGLSGNHVLMLRASRLGQTGCHDSAVSLSSTTPTIHRYSQSFGTHAFTLTNTLRSIGAKPGFNSETTLCYNNTCASGQRDSLFLCGRSAPVFPPVNVNTITNCSDSNFFAVSKSTVQFTDYTDSLMGNFDSSYRALCLQAYQMESFTVTQTQSEYHHTLYYYDQAGNLLKTVPPAGVNANYDSTWLASVSAARTAGTSVVPSHGLLTQYRYNTLNQVMAQQTPDAGQSHFWYDRLGRLAISQNARQRTVSGSEAGRQYSYTLYDSIGRITEVGQVSNVGSTPMSDSISRRESLLTSWITASASNKEQITSTVYDLPYTGFTGLSFTPVVQRNLRNRVAYSTFALGSNPVQYNQGTFYTYDIEGNVDTLLQDFGSSSFTGLQNIMNTNGNRFKRMVYNYDLVSGKVNSVAYQPHQADAFYHRYTYDAENRLILTETSSDSVYWDKEARYQYYKHGPLARTILGDKMVQGLDYAYTLQGWLKGVNSASLTPGYDMGRDGDTTWQNRYVAKDAFGFGLNYFSGDYSAIGTSTNPFPGTSAYLNTSYRPLYNGNISSMAVNIAELYKFDSSHWRGPMLYNYRYDQLNRITGMDAFYGLNQSTNSWSALTATPDFKERGAYDPNGNIQKYLRNNFGGTGLPMDSLGYGYIANTNKLAQIRDSASDVIGGGYDLHSQPTNNYAYDSIGNLIKDSIEHISLIKWNVYGKITEIDHSTTTIAKPTKNIYYYYDAAGNRIGKKTTSGDSSIVSYTWYVRDASGNVMATYTGGIDSSSALSAADLHVGEKDIYGSSRLGLLNANYSVDAAGDGFSAYTSPWSGVHLPYYTGRKQYELANHLGNVLATISDKKIGVSLSSDSSLIDHYEADVQTAQDYYPFGMIMPGRMFTNLSIPGGSIDSGTSQVNGYTLPVDLVLTSRTTDMPSQYVATQMIDLDQGFQSGDSTDVFTAYIADTTYAGTGNGGSDPDGVAGQGKYRYGFNGKENDNEVKGIGNTVDFGNRIDDTRIGRWFSTDRVTKPWLSPYCFAANNPVNNVDPDGKDEIHFHFYTNSVIGPDGKVMGGPTTFRIEIIKANGPDRFFHHAHSNVIRMPTNYSSGGQSIGEKTTEFYPWNPDSRSGLTKSTIAGIIPWNDHDFATLIKYATASPALKEYLKQRSQGYEATNYDKENYKGLLENLPIYNTIAKIKQGAELAAGILSLVDGGLAIISGSEKITALGSSQGNWGALKSAGKLGDFRILEVKVDPELFKTAAGRDFVWETINKPFLDRAIEKGQSFKLLDDPKSNLIFPDKDPSKGLNFFGREVNYLIKDKGYKIEGDYLVPGKKQ